jgi:hypothetical protein
MDLWWIKFPKVGSSFGSTVIGFACGCEVHATTERGIAIPSECNLTRVGQVLNKDLWTHSMPWYEAPVIWQNNKPLHNIIAVFRDPLERRLSEFNYFIYKKMSCCGFIELNSVARAQATGIILSNNTLDKKMNQYLLWSSKHYQGCMINMLTGKSCFAGNPNPHQLDLAIQLVKNMKFVGLQERWSETVTLWHAMFKGPIYPNELQFHHNKNKSSHTTHIKYSDIDSILFKHAKSRFISDIFKWLNPKMTSYTKLAHISH